MPEARLIPASQELNLVLAALMWMAICTDPDTSYMISSFFSSEMAIESFLDLVELECAADFLETLISTTPPTLVLPGWVGVRNFEYWLRL